MIGLPWYLLAVGILIVIVGFLLAGLPGSSRRRRINPRMSDDEIIQKLKEAERIPFSSMVIVLGFLCILVSVVWRLARYFF